MTLQTHVPVATGNPSHAFNVGASAMWAAQCCGGSIIKNDHGALLLVSADSRLVGGHAQHQSSTVHPKKDRALSHNL